MLPQARVPHLCFPQAICVSRQHTCGSTNLYTLFQIIPGDAAEATIACWHSPRATVFPTTPRPPPCQPASQPPLYYRLCSGHRPALCPGSSPRCLHLFLRASASIEWIPVPSPAMHVHHARRARAPDDAPRHIAAPAQILAPDSILIAWTFQAYCRSGCHQPNGAVDSHTADDATAVEVGLLRVARNW